MRPTILLVTLALTVLTSACQAPSARLLDATEVGDTASMRILLDEDQALLSTTAPDGRALLQVAVAANQGDAVALLLERGAPLDPSMTPDQLRPLLADASSAVRARAGLDRRDGVWIGETSQGKPFGFAISREAFVEGWAGLEVIFSDVPSYVFGSRVEMTLGWCESAGCVTEAADGSFSATRSGTADALGGDPYQLTTRMQGAFSSDSVAEGRLDVKIDEEAVEKTWSARRVTPPSPFPVVEVDADPSFVELANGWANDVVMLTSAEDPIQSLSDLTASSDVCVGDGIAAHEFMQLAGHTDGVEVCYKADSIERIRALLITDTTWLPWVSRSAVRVRLRPSPGKKPAFGPTSPPPSDLPRSSIP